MKNAEQEPSIEQLERARRRQDYEDGIAYARTGRQWRHWSMRKAFSDQNGEVFIFICTPPEEGATESVLTIDEMTVTIDKQVRTKLSYRIDPASDCRLTACEPAVYFDISTEWLRRSYVPVLDDAVEATVRDLTCAVRDDMNKEAA